MYMKNDFLSHSLMKGVFLIMKFALNQWIMQH